MLEIFARMPLTLRLHKVPILAKAHVCKIEHLLFFQCTAVIVLNFTCDSKQLIVPSLAGLLDVIPEQYRHSLH